MPYPSALTPNLYFAMAKVAQLQQFANSNFTLEELRQQAGVLLSNRDISRSALGLSPEDQTKLVDKLDQVRRDPLFFFADLRLIALKRRIQL